MDGSLRVPLLVRMLTLNTEICEMQTELFHATLGSGRIARLQEDIDRHCRTSLTTCWLSGGYDLEAEEDWGDEGLSAAD